MEVEFQRKLITLENSVKDVDERLAELYRETAGLSLQKASVIQKVKRDAAASKKHAAEVRRIHSDLKSSLDSVSSKLARMDAVIKKLNSMRRAARKEKSKEFAQLASSILRLNKKVSKINKLVKDVRAASDPRIDLLKKEMAGLKKFASERPSKLASVNIEPALARLESMIDQKIDSGQLRDALGDVSGALSAEIRTLSRSLSSLEKQLHDVESSISKVSKGAKAGVASPLDLVKLERVDKKMGTIRKRANSILKEIYDTIDELRAAHAAFQDQAAQNSNELHMIKQRIETVEKRFSALPRISADDTELDLTGVVAEMEELREYVNTLAKGLDISKAIAEELKATQSKLSSIESWKNRAQDVPRELEKLAERLANLEAVEGVAGNFAEKEDLERTSAQLNKDLGALRAKAETDMKNLKMTVAEFSNKLRMINTLALENQKMQNRLFALEDMLDKGALEKKLTELESKIKGLQPPEDGLHTQVADLQAELEHIRPMMLGLDDVNKRVELLESSFRPRPLQEKMKVLESEIRRLSEQVQKNKIAEQDN